MRPFGGDRVSKKAGARSPPDDDGQEEPKRKLAKTHDSKVPEPFVGPTSAPLAASSEPFNLSLLQFNAWFDPVHTVQRLDAICDIARQCGAHVITLQELTPEMLEYLIPVLTLDGYKTSKSISIQPRAYGEGIFVKRPLIMESYTRRPLQDTIMGRELHVVKAKTPNGKVVSFATVHLESTAEFQKVRLAQLDKTFEDLNLSGLPWIVAGDTNLGKRDKVILPAGVKDAWVDAGSDRHEEVTWDTRINKNLPDIKFKAFNRFDRIYFAGAGVSVTHFRTVGKSKVPGTKVYPSDHWGLHAELLIE
ncbi:hypothetical protein HK101_011782 [Irineochytrium annulatum]|nr:hypothetical protein HK101_011782 [Irineochytrium annulatum]